MSQNYSHHGLNALSQNSVRSNLNDFSGSIDQESPLQTQQQLMRPWPGTLGWQNVGNQSYNNGIQGGDDNLHSSNSQLDYVPFDDGGDLYNDEEEEPWLAQEANNSRRHDLKTIPKLSRTTFQSVGQGPVAHASSTSGPQFPNNQSSGSNSQKGNLAANDRAAELRAKLIAQQRASGTPTPSSANKRADFTPQKPLSKPSCQIGSKGTLGHQAPNGSRERQEQDTTVEAVNDKSSEPLQATSSRPTTSDADIEGLIAYGKAVADAQNIPKETTTNAPAMDGLGSARSEELNVGKKERSVKNRRGAPGSNRSSSEASELGEIRESIPMPPPAHPSSKPSSPAMLGEPINKERLASLISSHSKPNGNCVTPETTKKVETTDRKDPMNQSLVLSERPKQTESERPTMTRSNSARASERTQPSHDCDRTHGVFQPSSQKLRTDRQKEHPQSSFLPRDGWPEARHKEQAYRNSFEPSGPGHNHHIGADQDYRSPLEQCHSRDVTAKGIKGVDRRTSDDHRNELIHASSAVDESMTAVAVGRKSAANAQATLNRLGTIDGAPDSESPDQIMPFDPSVFGNQLVHRDVIDWLEMTGYHNVPHRVKRIEIHRKKKALDLQKAELEREEQLELEQHSRSMRASSVYPVMGSEGNLPSSIFSDQTAWVSSASIMPPPPLRSKDDIGIKIKDSANRESQPSSRGVENDLISKQPTNASSNIITTTKRQHPADVEYRRDGHTEKMPRLDLGNKPQDNKSLKSPAIKDESLESRISRNPEPRSAGYRRRSRSPERRRRSLSPILRRASDTGGYYGYQRDLPRPDIRSPATSRHASPSRRNSGTRDPPLYRDGAHPENDYEARTQDEREFHYQRYVPNNSRGRGRGRTHGFANYRGYKPHSGRGGMQGIVNGNGALSLQEGGQSLK